MKKTFAAKSWLVFCLIAIIEMFSFFGYYFPQFNEAAFFIIIAVVIVAACEDLALGVGVLLAELFLGSKGYLFHLDVCGFQISWRIALWAVVMAIWAFKAIKRRLQDQEELVTADQHDFLKPYLLLLFFVIIGAVNGLVRGHSLNNWFLDLNGWIYFTLIFPLYEIFIKKDKAINWQRLKVLFYAAMYFLCLKTILVFLLLKYGQGDFALDIYRWVRTSGVGEVTITDTEFYRTFFQSQIFIIAVLIIDFFSYISAIAQKKISLARLSRYYFNFILFTGVILISLSRSFWFGLGLAMLTALVLILIREGKKIFWHSTSFIVISTLAAIGLVALLAWTAPQDFLMRTNINKNEPAVASRWALLAKIGEEIKEAPILGQGFGATITYLSKDPRVNGEYTTYAFEWGWLDVWLKLGLLGLLTYLFIFVQNIYAGLKSKDYMANAVAITLLALGLVNIFSPYVNHPLGIGLLLLGALAIVTKQKIR
ncbi:MAG TPA: O-antigen ligase family protein [bacterium]|nr:O-antigen ligase family protein [bacterium]